MAGEQIDERAERHCLDLKEETGRREESGSNAAGRGWGNLWSNGGSVR